MTTLLAIESPFTQYFDLDGSPLDAGYLYFGATGQNPQTNPITVYWDQAGTQPAAQPVRTLNGYPVRSGSPAQIYSPTDYSLDIVNKKSVLVAYSASSLLFNNFLALQTDLQNQIDDLAGEVIPAVDNVAALLALTSSAFPGGKLQLLGYWTPGGPGGGLFTTTPNQPSAIDNGGTVFVDASGRPWYRVIVNGKIDVKDFGAKGDDNGTTYTDDTASCQAAINWVQAHTDPATYASNTPYLGPVELNWSAGNYAVNQLNITRKIAIKGEGPSETSSGTRIVQQTSGGTTFVVTPGAGGMSISFENLTIENGVGGAGDGIHILGGPTGGACNSVRILNCFFFAISNYAININYGDDVIVRGCTFDGAIMSAQSSIVLGQATAGQVVTNVQILGNGFVNQPRRCIQINNVIGLIAANNKGYSSAGANTLYFIDALNTAPPNAARITAIGNELDSFQCLFASSGCSDLLLHANPMTNVLGNAFSTIIMTGTSTNAVITDNPIKGAWSTGFFVYDDTGATAVNKSNISGNTFTQTGVGASFVSRPVACSKTTGRIRGNAYIDFAQQSVGGKFTTSGGTFTPGTIFPGGTYVKTFSFPDMLAGDTLTVTPTGYGYPVPLGTLMTGYAHSAGNADVQYVNATTANAVCPAHDLVLETAR